MITGQVIMLSNAVQSFSYIGIFFLLLFGYLPLIGSFLPGSFILFFAGFLSKAGPLSLIVIFILGCIAIFLGDCISYSFGRTFGKKFLEKYSKYFFIKPKHIEKSYKLVKKHTGKSIILGKFNPISRPLVPFLVGAHSIGFSEFIFYDIFGCAIWAGTFLLLGWFFGHSYNIIENFSVILIGLVILLIIACVSYYLIKRGIEKFKNGDS